MPRRPRNPSGIVQPRQTKSGRRWQGIVQYPDPDKPGAWKQRSQTFERKAEAQAWVDKALTEHRSQPNYKPPSDELFGSYLERWLENASVSGRRSSTIDSYRYVTRHIILALGARPLATIRASHLQGLYTSLLQRGYATSTINSIHTVINQSLGEAVDLGLLSQNPAQRVKKPRVVRKDEIVPPTVQQAAALLQSVDGDRLRGLWWFVALTGCRRGEALGLRWEDVDLNAGTAKILRTLAGKGAKRELHPPKTARGKRVVALSSVLVDALQRHREQQLLERQAAGDRWQDTGFVFTTSHGKLLGPDWARKKFKEHARKAGLPDATRLHDLRHALATTWLAEGVPIQVVSERLGHASIAITLQLYAHVLPNQQAEAAERIDEKIARVSTASVREHGSRTIL